MVPSAAPKCLLPPRDSHGKPNKSAMSFAQLYSDDIEDYMKLNFTHCYSFERFFKPDVFEELVRRESLPLEVARKATTDHNAYEIMDRLLIDDNQELWAQIHFLNVPKSSSFEVFASRFLVPSGNFLVLDRVAAVLDVEPLLEHLCPGTKYPTLREAVRNGPQISAKMARRFLRELPRLEGNGEDWFWRLIEACTRDAHNIARTLEYLLPNWQTELAAHRSSIAYSSHSFDSLQRVLVAGVTCRPPAEFEPFRNEMTVPHTLVMPELREYQKELVERTNRGENTIVCAPTGSGKTVVGAHVALHHLKSRAKQGKPARVVMIVPKVFLVEQQANLFKKYTNKEFYIAKLSGDTTETGEAQLITFLSGDIVVLTPQILVNMLGEESEKARLYVADISLLLLDECHHTDKKNPYNIIMQYVKEAKHERPQVVGLTASLGVGDGGIIVEDQAINHIVRTCLRMAADSITTVMRNRAELASFVQLPEDVIRRVMPMPLHERRFHSHLMTAINFVERHLYAEFDALMLEKPKDVDLNLLTRFPPIERFEEYTQAVVNVDTELRKLMDGERKWRLKRGIDFVKMYHKASLLNDLLPASYAFEQLSSDVTELESAPQGRKCSFLDHFNIERLEFEKRVVSEIDKEILQELRKELTKQFVVDDNSRVLIFCLRRETAQLLVKYLNQMAIRGMGRAEVLTSTNAAGVKNGQSNSEQRAVIESFTKGACKVIVSTSVAEEGLDVAACNLIIKYNTTGNVISLVQQRGRARASNSRSVLLALDEKVYAKEHKNKIAEGVMMRAVEKIYAMGDAQFGELIDKQKMVETKQEEANQKEMEKRNANKHRELSLLCEKCNELICSSTSLRLFHNHIISVDSTLWRKMRVQVSKKGQIQDDALDTGIVRCKCEKEVGRVVKIAGQFVPTLKAETILFRTPGGDMLKKMKKWKGIAANLLDIRDGTTLEATAMNRALQSSNATLSRALENLCLL